MQQLLVTLVCFTNVTDGSGASHTPNIVHHFALQVESGSMLAAGSVVEAGTTVPSGELWAGNPARKLRALKEDEQAYLKSLPSR